MLPAQPPKYATWSALYAPITRGETGWRVYALQAGIGAVPDGNFGPQTFATLRAYQASKRLYVDGVAGPRTQGAVLEDAERQAHLRLRDLPLGVMQGMAEYEGGRMLAPTNWYTPPNAPPGVDCGPIQRRLAGPPFTLSLLKEAFHPEQAFLWAGQMLVDRVEAYMHRRPTLTRRQAVELAVLAHNAPFLAEQIVRNGRLTTPNALAGWTTKPGGGHYTHAEWRVEYPRRIMKYVS